MQDELPGAAAPDSTPTPRNGGVCTAVRARLSELLVGDLPAAMKRELEPHVAIGGCARCRAELAAFAAIVADLERLPLHASPARSWAGIQRAITAERLAQPQPWLTQVAALAAAGLVVAATLVNQSAALAARLAAPATLRPILLPGLFVLFGAAMALAALPLLRTSGRPALEPLRAPLP